MARVRRGRQGRQIRLVTHRRHCRELAPLTLPSQIHSATRSGGTRSGSIVASVDKAFVRSIGARTLTRRDIITTALATANSMKPNLSSADKSILMSAVFTITEMDK